MFYKFHYASLSSTQDQAKQLITEDDTAFIINSIGIITAESQTQGRGRYGKSWASPKGDGIYVTFVQNFADYKIAEDFINSFTVKVAEILQKQLEKVFIGYKFDIKPINDIYYQGSKLAGILVETFTYANQVYIITGIGINVYKSKYLIKEQLPDNPKAAPIALAEIVDDNLQDFDQDSLLENIALDLVGLSLVYT